MHRLFTFLFFLIVLLLGGCDDDKYIDVCAGEYGSEQFVDSIAHRYHLHNAVSFSEWYKEYNVPRYVHCDTIHLRISANNMSFLYNDTFALSVAKIFFTDSANIHVHSLSIEVTDSWSMIGSAEVNFTIDRTYLQNIYTLTEPDDVVGVPYKVVEEQSFIQDAGDGEEAGMKILVTLHKDCRNVEKLAAKLKRQYNAVIKAKQLHHFEIDVSVQLLADRLCTSKTYHYFYTRSNKNI